MILKASKRLRKFFDNSLTDEMIWNEIIEEKKLNNIHQLNRLNRQAAEILILQEKRMELLTLGISELPVEVAEELVKYDGEKLFLNCVTSLTKETAKALSKYRGIKLMLNGVKVITLPILGRLASYRGILNLDGIEEWNIEEKDARRARTVFNNLELSKLSMACLTNPSPILLSALSLFPGQLALDGIQSLSRQESETLSEFLGKGLSLKGIKSLSRDYLKLFTQYTGHLDFSGATEIEDDFVWVAASRPDGFTLFSRPVMRRIVELKRKMALEKKQRQRESQEINRIELEQQRITELKNLALLKEFEKFDQLDLEPVKATALAEESTAEDDIHGPDIDETVVNDIEQNLNQEIATKKKRVDQLLAKGYSNLSRDEKDLLKELKEKIEELKVEIRGALDILVEKKELGSVVFDNSNDLAAYLKQSGAEEDEDDALANIEEFDMFGNTFDDGSGDQVEEISQGDAHAMMDMWGDSGDAGSLDFDQPEEKGPPEIEGDDFVFTEVTDSK